MHQMLSWNITILGITTSRPDLMPTEPATHANSSNFDDKLHERNMLGLRRPSPSWVTGCSSSLPHGPSTAAPTPQQHGEAQERSLNTPEKMTTEARAATQSKALLATSSLQNCTKHPRPATSATCRHFPIPWLKSAPKRYPPNIASISQSQGSEVFLWSKPGKVESTTP
jgi:hypothetical protein